MGNTVGSKFIFKTAEDYYALGLWLADGYWRSSSVGLTSVDSRLIERFVRFLRRAAPSHPLKYRTYHPLDGRGKRRRVATQVYVNSRALTRMFTATKTGVLFVPSRNVPAYLAGRIDGDGHVDAKHRSGIRIAYGNAFDARRDRRLFGAANVSLYRYSAARTMVLYLRKHYRERIEPAVRKFSMKLAP